jgi:hypothetical protein
LANLFASHSSLDFDIRLRCRCKGPQGLLIFYDKGCPATANKLLSRKSAEQAGDGFTRDPEDLSDFLMGQGKFQAKSAPGLIILVYIPVEENPGKFFRGRVGQPKQSHTVMHFSEFVAQARHGRQAHRLVPP